MLLDATSRHGQRQRLSPTYPYFRITVLPVLLFTANFMVPQTVSIGQAKIEHVSPNTPAAAAGLQAGDVIVKIDGHKIQNVSDDSADCPTVYAPAEVLEVVRGDLLNDRVFPDFERLSAAGPPLVRLEMLTPGRPVQVAGLARVMGELPEQEVGDGGHRAPILR